MHEVYGLVFVNNLRFIKRAIGIANWLDSPRFAVGVEPQLSGAAGKGTLRRLWRLWSA